ncbi:MAG: hypothetical protein NTX50_13455 [Candidatus Sumerlaeota bacterium]|nr:hypothetical protein [Candidatus Sumerlaeota bacterium]
MILCNSGFEVEKIDPISSHPVPPSAPAEGVPSSAHSEADAIPLKAGQTVDVVVEAIRNGIARIQIEGRTIEARAEIPLAPGTRIRMTVDAVAPEIVLRPAGGAPPRNATLAPLPATSSQAAAEVLDMLAQARSVLQEIESRGGLAPEEAEYLRQLARIFTQVSEAAPPATEAARQAIISYNQPVEAALARIIANPEAPRNLQSPGDVKVILAALQYLLNAKSQSSSFLTAAPTANPPIDQMLFQSQPLPPQVAPGASLIVAAPSNSPPAAAAPIQPAAPLAANGAIDASILLRLAQACGLTAPADVLEALKLAARQGTPLPFDAILARFVGLSSVPAPAPSSIASLVASVPAVAQGAVPGASQPQPGMDSQSPQAVNGEVQTARTSSAGSQAQAAVNVLAQAPSRMIRNAFMPSLESAIASADLQFSAPNPRAQVSGPDFALSLAQRVAIYGALREIFPSLSPARLLLALQNIEQHLAPAASPTSPASTASAAAPASTATAAALASAPAFLAGAASDRLPGQKPIDASSLPVSAAPKDANPSHAVSTQADLAIGAKASAAPAQVAGLSAAQREGLKTALMESFPQQIPRGDFAESAIQLIEARIFVSARATPHLAFPEAPKGYAPPASPVQQTAPNSQATVAPIIAPNLAVQAKAPGAQPISIQPIPPQPIAAQPVVAQPMSTQPLPAQPAALRSSATPSPNSILSPTQPGELLAALDRSISLQTASQIIKDPTVTPQKLQHILMTAPRLAAMAFLNGEISHLNLVPMETQWTEQRLASLLQSAFASSAEAAPSFAGAAIQSQASLIMALKALSQSAAVPETPLTRLINAAQTPAAAMAGKFESLKTALAGANMLYRAWEALARESDPISRAIAEQTLAAIHRGETALAAPAADGGRSDGLVLNPWLPALFESRLLTAPWAVAPRMPAGWAEVLFGLVSLSNPQAGGASGAMAGALSGAVSKELAQVMLAIREGPQRRFQTPVRKALASLGSAVQEWESDLFAETQRQEVSVRAALNRLTSRFGELSELLDNQRLQNARAFDSGQPMTFWLPFVMDGRQGYARIDWTGESESRHAPARRGGYNILLALDLSHTGPLQFRCHVRQRRLSLEVASANSRLLDIARSQGARLRENLLSQGFQIEKLTFTNSVVSLDDPSPLSLAAAHPLSVNA